ncbi:MAG TPA: hypothetical protein V6D47_21350 [Oscillatoriaceae cyanobacterium]
MHRRILAICAIAALLSACEDLQGAFLARLPFAQQAGLLPSPVPAGIPEDSPLAGADGQSVEPFEGIHGQVCVVGQAIDLPSGTRDAPYQWRLVDRDAKHADLHGNRLVPRVPGGLALAVTSHGQTAYVFDAVKSSADLVRPFKSPYRVPPKPRFPQPVVASDETTWSKLWSTVYGEFDTRVGNFPPPVPPYPLVDFPSRSVLLTNVDVETFQPPMPVVTSVDGSVVHIAVPDARLPGERDPYAPAGGTPQQDLTGMRGPTTCAFDLPALPANVQVVIEPFPEAALVPVGAPTPAPATPIPPSTAPIVVPSGGPYVTPVPLPPDPNSPPPQYPPRGMEGFSNIGTTYFQAWVPNMAFAFDSKPGAPGQVSGEVWSDGHPGLSFLVSWEPPQGTLADAAQALASQASSTAQPDTWGNLSAYTIRRDGTIQGRSATGYYRLADHMGMRFTLSITAYRDVSNYDTLAKQGELIAQGWSWK